MTARGVDAGVALAAAFVVLVAGSAGLALGQGTPQAVDDDDDAAVHHPTPDGDAEPETRVVANGSTVNANGSVLPPGCEAIRGERQLTVDAGREYAADGDAFGYDLDSVTAPPCTRLVVTLTNHDDVRHQWVVDGLPTAAYPGGYVAIEVADRGSVTAAFVTPGQPGTYEGLSTLPQHEQHGMRLPLVVTGDGSADATTGTPTGDESSGTAPGPGPLLALAAALAAARFAARQ